MLRLFFRSSDLIQSHLPPMGILLTREYDPFTSEGVFPEHFLPEIGRLTIRHVMLDDAINATIWHIAFKNSTLGNAITSGIISLKTRLELLRRLIVVGVEDVTDKAKLFVLIRIAEDLSATRNRIMHDKGYWYSPSDDEVGMFRAEVFGIPQLKTTPPTRVSIRKLELLCTEMACVTSNLSRYCVQHEDWHVEHFPWPDKLREQLEKMGPDRN